jgi:hypothetical protein
VPANTEINLPIKSPDNDVPFIPAPAPEPTIIEIPTQPQPEAIIITPANPTMPTITAPPFEPPKNELSVLDKEQTKVEKMKQLEIDLENAYKKLNEKPETFSFLKTWKGAEKVGAITGSVISILGGISAVFIAYTPALSQFMSPDNIASIGAGLGICTVIAKTIYSTFNPK